MRAEGRGPRIRAEGRGTQTPFKNKSKRKRNFIIYYFLVESKPNEIIDLLITASVNIYQTKKSIPVVMKTFLKEK